MVSMAIIGLLVTERKRGTPSSLEQLAGWESWDNFETTSNTFSLLWSLLSSTKQGICCARLLCRTLVVPPSSHRLRRHLLVHPSMAFENTTLARWIQRLQRCLSEAYPSELVSHFKSSQFDSALCMSSRLSSMRWMHPLDEAELILIQLALWAIDVFAGFSNTKSQALQIQLWFLGTHIRGSGEQNNIKTKEHIWD